MAALILKVLGGFELQTAAGRPLAAGRGRAAADLADEERPCPGRIPARGARPVRASQRGSLGLAGHGAGRSTRAPDRLNPHAFDKEVTMNTVSRRQFLWTSGTMVAATMAP